MYHYNTCLQIPTCIAYRIHVITVISENGIVLRTICNDTSRAACSKSNNYYHIPVVIDNITAQSFVRTASFRCGREARGTRGSFGGPLISRIIRRPRVGGRGEGNFVLETCSYTAGEKTQGITSGPSRSKSGMYECIHGCQDARRSTVEKSILIGYCRL